MPCVAVVGSRKMTPYGKSVTLRLAGNLAKQGIVIISGLALGVDGLAHKAALDNGGKTIAVMPCGLDRIYPATHHALAKEILKHGGALISEYPFETDIHSSNFIERNRLISGLSLGVLIPEAAEKSGSLHTANFALEQGREVMAVPGNITSPLSVGTNNLIKVGATPVTDTQDVLNALGLKIKTVSQQELFGATEEESIILKLIAGGIVDGEELLGKSKLQAQTFSQTLTMLEITGKIKSIGSDQWTIY